GKQFTVDITPVAPPPVVNGAVASMGLMSAAKSQPLYRQKPSETFWFTYLADSQTTYVNFRGYKSLGEHGRALLAFLDSNPTKQLVIDLRQNGGGGFFLRTEHMCLTHER